MKADKLRKDVILLYLPSFKRDMRHLSRLSLFLQLLWPYRSILRVHSVSLSLNRVCLEPQKLFLFPGAAVRLTVNKPQINASQGQLAAVEQIPANNDDSLCLLLAPPGVRSLPILCPRTGSTDYSLWTPIAIWTRCSAQLQSCRGQFPYSCRPIQYPDKNFVPATIHKCMGDTINELATQINTTEKKYSLWMREQLCFDK